MSIQSEAALRSGGTRGGRKQQTVSTGQSQTNIQIGGANAPAVGALAPLVMPVPNLESANTLTQAIAAVNGFGTTFRAVGQYVARDRATIEADQFQSGGAMYEAWSATRQKASLEKNYDANQRAALGDTNLFISGNINAALSGLPEGRAKTHFSALIAQSSAASLAPYANEESTLNMARQVKGFGQQQFSSITNGDDAKARSAALDLAVANIMNMGNPGVAKSPDDVATLLIDNLLLQSASSGGSFETDIEPMLLHYQDVLRDSKIKHQALSQQARNREYQRVENVKQDVKKAGGTLLQRVDALKAGGVPDDDVLESIFVLTTAESAGNYDRSDLVDVSGYFSRLPEGDPRKAKWGFILDKGFENEQVSFAANLKTDYVNGKMSDLDFMNALTNGASKYDTNKSPGYQQSGAIDGDTFTKLLSLTTQNQVKRQKEAMVGQLLSRTLEATSSNMEAAGLDLSDISDPKLHQIAQQAGRYTKETSRALIVKASRGDAEAIKIISLASQSKVSLTADSGMNSEDVYMINWSNSMGSKFALDANGQVTPQSIQAYKEQAAFAASTPDIDILVDEARMEKANTKIRSGKKLDGKGTRTQIEERIRTQTDHAGKTKQNLFSGSDYEYGLFSSTRNETDAGLTLANGQLMDEVLFEVTNHFNLSNSPEVDIDGDEMTKIIDDSIKKVAGDYSILRAGGRSVSLVRKDQLQLRLGRTESMLNAEVDRVLAEKGLKSEDVESMHPYGNDPATGEMTYTIRMKSPDGRFPMFVHFNMSGVEDVIPGVMSKEAAAFFVSEEAKKQFPETAAVTNMLAEHVKDPSHPEHFMNAVNLIADQEAITKIVNSNATDQEKKEKINNALKGLPTPSLIFAQDQQNQWSNLMSEGIPEGQFKRYNNEVLKILSLDPKNSFDSVTPSIKKLGQNIKNVGDQIGQKLTELKNKPASTNSAPGFWPGGPLANELVDWSKQRTLEWQMAAALSIYSDSNSTDPAYKSTPAAGKVAISSGRAARAAFKSFFGMDNEAVNNISPNQTQQIKITIESSPPSETKNIALGAIKILESEQYARSQRINGPDNDPEVPEVNEAELSKAYAEAVNVIINNLAAIKARLEKPIDKVKEPIDLQPKAAPSSSNKYDTPFVPVPAFVPAPPFVAEPQRNYDQKTGGN